VDWTRGKKLVIGTSPEYGINAFVALGELNHLLNQNEGSDASVGYGSHGGEAFDRSELTRFHSFKFRSTRRSSVTYSLMSDEPQVKKRRMSVSESDATPAPVPNLLIKRLSDKARLPTRGSALAAGYDLYR
jgi:hypothetical protein